jgi:hypothetical protein
LLLASPAQALRPNTTIDPCPPKLSLPAFEKFAQSVWEKPRWERGAPKAKTIAAARQFIYCSRGSGKRGELKHRWEVLREQFYGHRAAKLANRRYLDAITPPGAGVLAAIRSCESGGDYSINTGNGFSGAYQFVQSTWESVGGSGAPHEASPREQDERAARLYREQGTSPWPVCGV